MADRDALIHLTAGGIGGTFGAVATCPLEVIKVRLQSSSGASWNGNNGSNNGNGKSRVPNNNGNSASTSAEFKRFQMPKYNPLGTASSLQVRHLCHDNNPSTSSSQSILRRTSFQKLLQHSQNNPHTLIRFQATRAIGINLTVYRLLREVVQKEGARALFKGVIPNVIGVAPSKAIYFYAYSSSKRFLNDISEVPNTPFIHMVSAGSAGFLTASIVNPLWLIKTRLQLDRHHCGVEQLTILKAMKRVYSTDGIKGFWKGVTASYVGIFETIVQFVLYEYLRATFVGGDDDIRTERDSSDFLSFMLCGGISKIVATSSWYPHEVCRTRLREEGNKYRTFFQTFRTVWAEEGRRGLYRGLSVHLLRAIPNTAITMGTYELAVYLLASVI